MIKNLLKSFEANKRTLGIAGGVAILLMASIKITNDIILSIVIVVVTFIISAVSIASLQIQRDRHINKHLHTDLGWLIHGGEREAFRNINEIEQSTQKEGLVFIITPNLKVDTTDKEIIETVSKNIQKGVFYRFFVPASEPAIQSAPQADHDVIFQRIALLRDIHVKLKDENGLLRNSVGRFHSHVDVYRVIDPFMRLLAYDNLMVIVQAQEPPAGYIQVPDGSGEWWAQMGAEASRRCLANIDYLIDRYKTSQQDVIRAVRKISWNDVPRLDQYDD